MYLNAVFNNKHVDLYEGRTIVGSQDGIRLEREREGGGRGYLIILSNVSSNFQSDLIENVSFRFKQSTFAAATFLQRWSDKIPLKQYLKIRPGKN